MATRSRQAPLFDALSIFKAVVTPKRKGGKAIKSPVPKKTKTGPTKKTPASAKKPKLTKKTPVRKDPTDVQRQFMTPPARPKPADKPPSTKLKGSATNKAGHLERLKGNAVINYCKINGDGQYLHLLNKKENGKFRTKAELIKDIVKVDVALEEGREGESDEAEDEDASDSDTGDSIMILDSSDDEHENPGHEARLDDLNGLRRDLAVKYGKLSGIHKTILTNLATPLDPPGRAIDADKYFHSQFNALGATRKLLAKAASAPSAAVPGLALLSACVWGCGEMCESDVCDNCRSSVQGAPVNVSTSALAPSGTLRAPSPSITPKAPKLSKDIMSLLPEGEIVDAASYIYYAGIDPLLASDTIARNYRPLCDYAPLSFDKTTGRMSVSRKKTFTLADDGSLTTETEASFKAKPIASVTDLLTRLDCLHRLESNFASSTHRTRHDHSTATKWAARHGWQAALNCVESIRYFRMSMGTYDTLGLKRGEDIDELINEMAFGRIHQETNGSARPTQGSSAPAVNSSTVRRPTASDKFTLSAALQTKCRTANVCLSWQTGACKESSQRHSIQPRDTSKPPFFVSHTCILCRGEHAGGASECRQ